MNLNANDEETGLPLFAHTKKDTKCWVKRIWHSLRGRYTLLLEAELVWAREALAREQRNVERLRLENRALLNSLLGTAGVPPVEEPRPAPQPIQAVRRRSWPQIAASREREASR
jgi:hypothetical protein